VIGVTADANIYISSLIFAGVPRQFVQAAEDGKFQLAISNALIVEVRRVLLVKFKWSEDDVAATIVQLAGCTTLVHPTQTIDAVPDDPDDNRVLECAVAANSSYIVTGDGDLLRLGGYAGIRMIRVADFLRLVEA
jgi:putative PIN family toxin of toxin-antitoxin system